MPKYILGSGAWIEYLEGTQQGKKIKEIIENPKNEIYTCSIMVAEVISKALKTGDEKIYTTALTVLRIIPHVVTIDFDIAAAAAKIYTERKKVQKDYRLSDAFLLATANKLKGKIIR